VTDTPEQAATGAGAGAAVTKADLAARFFAALIDVAVSVVVSFIPAVGGLLAAAYWLVRDGLDLDFMDGRSLGKKALKLRPIRLDGQPMDLATSMMRNWMFALGGVVSFLLFIPIIGWLLMIPVILAALALGIVELVLVVTDPEGRRIGDRMAGTRLTAAE
jgi:uncharacterized RDD family membrane protein YckC